MAAPVVSPVRGCGPDSGDRGPSAGKLMSLSHSLAADVEKQLATLDPPPESILAGRISLHPDGNRLAVSFVRQHGKIYMLEGFDESTSLFDPTDAAILAGRNGYGPVGRLSGCCDSATVGSARA